MPLIHLGRKKTSAEEVREGLSTLYPRIWRYALVLTRDQTVAYDLAQTVSLRALEKAHLYKEGTELLHWLLKMTRRVWLNELRATAVRQAGGLVSVDDVALPDGKPDMETNIFAREVFSMILDLPEAQRETVLLVYIEGLTYREAAGTLEIPIGTIMSRLAIARKKLATLMTREESKVI